jgi:NitT/TauT family transport system substrate-binding protein/sulfonate transport system substrate-binding protein
MTTRRGLLSGLSAAALGIPLGITASRSQAEPTKLVRVGFQKGEPILLAAKQQRTLETLFAPDGIAVQWIEFQFGPPMLEAMRVGSIDIGAVGDTPPVFAQAAHGDLLYIAAQRAGGQAILVPPGSTLQTLQDLRGKKIAFGRGSSAHNLTIAALEKAGLAYTDVQPVYLGPADAGPAFERGAIDAWTIWDPYYALYETHPGVRVLAVSTDILPQNSFLIGSRAFVEANPAITTKTIAELSRISSWAEANPAEVAKLVSDGTSMPYDPTLRAIKRSPFKVLPVSADDVRSQQEEADRFLRLGVIPIRINVADWVWRQGA